MEMFTERRRGPSALSPREAAFVTGLSEKTVNQAIDRAEVDAVRARRRGERGRRIAFADLVYLRVRQGLGRLLSAEGKRALRRKLGEWVRRSERTGTITLGAMEVRVAGEVETVERGIAEVERARALVVSDPAVRAGEPVVRGTRIAVHVLAELARQGATPQELLEDHPALTPESLDAALLYARMHPRRGRPRRSPWSGGVVVRKA